MSYNVQISNEKVTTRGGLIPILKHIKKCRIPQVIRSHVKKRPFWSTYTNEDIIIGLTMNVFCGKNRISQIERFRDKLSIIPELKLPSHDTIGRALKSMATETVTVERVTKRKNSKIVKTEVNYNKPLNEILVKSTKRLGLLPTGKIHTLDMDATFVSTKCKDAKAKSRKKTLGYAPMVCMIERMPVHISLRSGNAGPALNIKKDFDTCIELLEKNKVKVGRVRSDAAGYNKKFLESLDERGFKFNVRMPFRKTNSGLMTRLNSYSEWKKGIIETSDQIWDCEMADIPYNMYASKMDARIICVRVPDKETIKANCSEKEAQRMASVSDKLFRLNEKGLLKRKGKLYKDAWTNYEGYNYKLIITNDFNSSPIDLMKEYNKRGGAERNFEYLKQDFGWKYPPFMYIGENNVYLIITALINNIFMSALRTFNEHVKGIGHNSRLPIFIDIVVEVSCKIIDKVTFRFYIDRTIVDFEKIC